MWAKRHGFPSPIKDVTNGFEEVYAAMLRGISPPDILIVPIGTGATFLGLAKEVSRKRWKTLIVGVGEMEKDTIADKIKGPVFYWKQIKRYLQKGHEYVRVTNKEIKIAIKITKNILPCEPTAAAAFAALFHIKDKQKRIFVVNTGKGKL